MLRLWAIRPKSLALTGSKRLITFILVSKFKLAFLLTGLFLSVLLIYSPSWENPFVLDDLTKIQNNPDLQVTEFNWHNFIFSYSEKNTQLRVDPSRPLTYIVYWLCWQFEPNSTYSFHIVNSSLHAAMTVLVAILVAQLLLLILGFTSWSIAALTALIFATAPLIGGTVIYIYGLSDLMSAVLMLFALVLMMQDLPKKDWQKGLLSFFSCVLLLLALATKQSSVILSPLFLLLDGSTKKLNRSRVYWLHLPIFVLVAVYLLWRQSYFGAIGDLEGRGSILPWDDYFLGQGLMIFDYLKMLIWPAGLTIDHLVDSRDLSMALGIAAWVAITIWLLGSLILSLQFLRKNDSRPNPKLVVAVGSLFFLICILPTSSLMPTVDMFVERRAYLPSVGLYLIFAGIMTWLSQSFHRSLYRWIFILGVTSPIVAAQTAATQQRINVYASNETLWREAIEINPLNRRAKFNLISYYSANKNYDAAMDMLEKMRIDNPSDGAIYSKLGYIYMQTDYHGHNLTKALSLLETSLQTLPDNIFALYNSGMIYLTTHRYAEAERRFEQAFAMNPLMATAFERAGEAAFAQNKRDKAIRYFRKSIELNANQDDAKEFLRRMGVSP